MYPKNLITQILEAAFMLALAAFLIKTAVGWILEIWPVLLVIAIIITAIQKTQEGVGNLG